MSSDRDRFRRIDELFHAALERKPHERSSFLRVACKDDSKLRREIESLLKQQDGSLLDGPAWEHAGSLLGHEAIAPGAQLGPYRIEARIGAGGMGEVYRATDTRLGRDVAIKVSARQFSGRFEREARAIASLNHSNICTLYDVGPNYLVMELIEGPTLAERIQQGPVPLEEALGIAKQIAEALRAAHAKGIVHRDLKPGNVKIRSDGTVKVLDFGLAKLAPASASDSPSEETATLTTRAGLIMGTAAYMAPEQAQGKRVDNRADIWAFGVVLYEMLTGQRLFRGETVSDTLGAVLTKEPEWEQAPARVQRLLKLCLEKDTEKRLADISSVWPLLEEAPPAASPRQIQVPWAGNGAKRRFGWLPIAAGLMVLAGVALSLWLLRPHKVAALRDTDTILLADFTNSTGDQDFDGLQAAFATDLQESPFLSVLTNDAVNETLRQMGQKPGTRLTEDIVREVCQRAASKAYFASSIARPGGQYIVGVKAVNCETGEPLAQAQERAKDKNGVLGALDKATAKLREKVGESLASIEKNRNPLPGTTTSFEAWKSWSQGRRTWEETDNLTAALPLYQHAVQLDPNFAIAQADLGEAYLNLGDRVRGDESIRTAFRLRDNTSEWEKYAIEAHYYEEFVGDLEKARSVYEAWAIAYPRYADPVDEQAFIDAQMGKFEKAITEARAAIQLHLLNQRVRDSCDLVSYYISSKLLQEARAESERNLKEIPNSRCDHQDLYIISFLENNRAGMEKEVAWGNQHEDIDMNGIEAGIDAYFGRNGNARKLSRAMIASFQGSRKGDASFVYALGALREALFGNRTEVQKLVDESRKLAALGPRRVSVMAIALALAEATEQAQKFAGEVAAQYREDTIFRLNYLPTIQALIDLDRNNPANALQELQGASTWEFGEVVPLFSVYVRGLAYLASHEGAEAAREFQRILDNRGVIALGVPIDALALPIHALAHVGLARAYALQGDTAKARGAYQEFFTIWRDADPEIPILKEAQAEFKKLH